jgi:hypothetical protein
MHRIRENREQITRVQQAKERKEEDSRQSKIQNSKKWDEFRIRKDIQIDKYIAARNRQDKAQQFIKAIQALFIIKRVQENFLLLRAKKTRQAMIVFTVFKMSIKFKVRIGRSYGGLEYKLKHTIRDACTLMSVMTHR